jgi:hypothetical protein
MIATATGNPDDARLLRGGAGGQNRSAKNAAGEGLCTITFVT